MNLSNCFSRNATASRTTAIGVLICFSMLWALGLPTQAHGAIQAGDKLLIDFGRSGIETTPNWNNKSGVTGAVLSPSTSIPLLANLVRNSDGAATLVDLYYTALNGVGGMWRGLEIGGNENLTAANFSGYPLSASRDTISITDIGASPPSTAVFELRNLDPNLTYNLRMFGSVTFGDTPPVTRFGADTDGDGTVNVFDTYQPNNNGSAAADYADFNNVAPTISGVIRIEFSHLDNGANIQQGSWGVFEINAIPEPSIGIGIVCLAVPLLLRRRAR